MGWGGARNYEEVHVMCPSDYLMACLRKELLNDKQCRP